MKKLLLILVLAFFLFIALVVLSFINRPYSDCVTVEGIENAALNGGVIMAKIGDDYYEIETSSELCDLFSSGDWEMTREKSFENAVISFRFAEEWIVEFHADGKVCAYYGYASRKEKKIAYYEIPDDTADKLATFVVRNGDLKEGKAYRSAFYY